MMISLSVQLVFAACSSADKIMMKIMKPQGL